MLSYIVTILIVVMAFLFVQKGAEEYEEDKEPKSGMRYYRIEDLFRPLEVYDDSNTHRCTSDTHSIVDRSQISLLAYCAYPIDIKSDLECIFVTKSSKPFKGKRAIAIGTRKIDGSATGWYESVTLQIEHSSDWESDGVSEVYTVFHESFEYSELGMGEFPSYFKAQLDRTLIKEGFCLTKTAFKITRRLYFPLFFPPNSVILLSGDPSKGKTVIANTIINMCSYLGSGVPNQLNPERASFRFTTESRDIIDITKNYYEINLYKETGLCQSVIIDWPGSVSNEWKHILGACSGKIKNGSSVKQIKELFKAAQTGEDVLGLESESSVIGPDKLVPHCNGIMVCVEGDNMLTLTAKIEGLKSIRDEVLFHLDKENRRLPVTYVSVCSDPIQNDDSPEELFRVPRLCETEEYDTFAETLSNEGLNSLSHLKPYVEYARNFHNLLNDDEIDHMFFDGFYNMSFHYYGLDKGKNVGKDFKKLPEHLAKRVGETKEQIMKEKNPHIMVVGQRLTEDNAEIRRNLWKERRSQGKGDDVVNQFLRTLQKILTNPVVQKLSPENVRKWISEDDGLWSYFLVVLFAVCFLGVLVFVLVGLFLKCMSK